MAGAYCKFCDHRCFVYRVLKDGRGVHLATCSKGMEHDRKVCGEDHTTAVNPHDPLHQAFVEAPINAGAFDRLGVQS